MKLAKFVSTALCEIIDGVCEAQEYAKSKGAMINAPANMVNPTKVTSEVFVFGDKKSRVHYARMVDFDIEVTTESGKTAETEAGLVVLPFFAKVKAVLQGKETSSGRIRFSVPVYLPTKTK